MKWSKYKKKTVSFWITLPPKILDLKLYTLILSTESDRNKKSVNVLVLNVLWVNHSSMCSCIDAYTHVSSFIITHAHTSRLLCCGPRTTAYMYRLILHTYFNIFAFIAENVRFSKGFLKCSSVTVQNASVTQLLQYVCDMCNNHMWIYVYWKPSFCVTYIVT